MERSQLFHAFAADLNLTPPKEPIAQPREDRILLHVLSLADVIYANRVGQPSPAADSPTQRALYECYVAEAFELFLQTAELFDTDCLTTDIEIAYCYWQERFPGAAVLRLAEPRGDSRRTLTVDELISRLVGYLGLGAVDARGGIRSPRRPHSEPDVAARHELERQAVRYLRRQLGRVHGLRGQVKLKPTDEQLVRDILRGFLRQRVPVGSRRRAVWQDFSEVLSDLFGP